MPSSKSVFNYIVKMCDALYYVQYTAHCQSARSTHVQPNKSTARVFLILFLCSFEIAACVCVWIIRAAQTNVKVWQLTRKMTKTTRFKTIGLIHIYVLRNAHKHSTKGNVTRKRKQFKFVRTHTTVSRMYECEKCDFYMVTTTLNSNTIQCVAFQWPAVNIVCDLKSARINNSRIAFTRFSDAIYEHARLLKYYFYYRYSMDCSTRRCLSLDSWWIRMKITTNLYFFYISACFPSIFQFDAIVVVFFAGESEFIFIHLFGAQFSSLWKKKLCLFLKMDRFIYHERRTYTKNKHLILMMKISLYLQNMHSFV